ncbi:MAG: amidohydrolase family protein, partial [Bacteroidota bacterium]
MRFFLCLTLLVVFASCKDDLSTKSVDLLITNARIYSVNDDFSIYSSMAISDGKIVGLHQNKSPLDKYDSDEIIDLKGKTVYPGFIDAHAHLYHLGMLLQQVDLSETDSFNEVIDKVIRYQEASNSPYIIGHGWDQNKWGNNNFPTKDTLDALFPNTPVALSRIDGHAMLCNSAALEKAKITSKTESDNGKILKQNNQLTGILIDSPMQKVFNTFPEFSKS